MVAFQQSGAPFWESLWGLIIFVPTGFCTCSGVKKLNVFGGWLFFACALVQTEPCARVATRVSRI